MDEKSPGAIGQITEWVKALREKDQAAAAELWDSFRARLELLARREISKLPVARSFDEEDIAQSAFFSFCRQLQDGKFSSLASRDELWWLLIVITKRKANDKARYDCAAKRSLLSPVDEQSSGVPLLELSDAVVAGNADPQESVAMREQCQRLLQVLEDDELRMIAIWKLEGHTNDEISARLMRTRQTIQRKLNIIRSIWSRELEDQEEHQ